MKSYKPEKMSPNSGKNGKAAQKGQVVLMKIMPPNLPCKLGLLQKFQVLIDKKVKFCCLSEKGCLATCLFGCFFFRGDCIRLMVLEGNCDLK